MSLALEEGGNIKEIGIFWSDSSQEASGTNALERWRMFKAWIEQYRNIQKTKTIDEEDLKLIEKAVDEAIKLKQQGKDTIEIANQIIVFSARIRDKYLNYPARLRIADREGTSEDSLRAYIDDAKKLMSIKNEYILEERKDKPIACFNPATNKIEIDRALAKIAPPYDVVTLESQAFRALIEDILRFTLFASQGIVGAHAISENIRYFADGHLVELEKIFSILNMPERFIIDGAYWKELFGRFPYITQIKPIFGEGLEQQDPARPLYGQSMPSPEAVMSEYPLILSVHLPDWEEDTHCGSLLATPYAYQLAKVQAAEKYGIDLDVLFKQSKARIAMLHDAGSAKRCSPMSQSQNNSRGDIRVVGTLVTPEGKEVPLTLQLAVAIQNSVYATADKVIDVHYVSQLYFDKDKLPEYRKIMNSSEPYRGYDVFIVTSSDPEVVKLHEQSFEVVFGKRRLEREGRETEEAKNLLTKFVIGLKGVNNVRKEDLRDLGMYLADSKGNVYKNSPKGTYEKDLAKLSKDLRELGDQIKDTSCYAAYSCGSHRLRVEFIEALWEYFREGIEKGLASRRISRVWRPPISFNRCYCIMMRREKIMRKR